MVRNDDDDDDDAEDEDEKCEKAVGERAVMMGECWADEDDEHEEVLAAQLDRDEMVDEVEAIMAASCECDDTRLMAGDGFTEPNADKPLYWLVAPSNDEAEAVLTMEAELLNCRSRDGLGRFG
jgi:hypothetical protein